MSLRWRNVLRPAQELSSHGVSTGTRRRIFVTGTVADVTVAERPGNRDLVATIEGSATVLVWWGRESISGIATGAHISAEGCPSVYRGRLALLNPSYELKA